jgi:2'-5' RNA ligase
VFDRLEYWKPPGIVCAVSGTPGPCVHALAAALRSGLIAGGFSPDLKPFRPHVTLARKVHHPTCSLNMHSTAWNFTQLALIESRPGTQGSTYGLVESYPFAHPQSGPVHSG